jgi:copper chaperone
MSMSVDGGDDGRCQVMTLAPDVATFRSMFTPTLTVVVPGMTCGHCEAAVTGEVSKVKGVTSVAVDLATKLVTIVGSDDAAAIADAIDEAGFEVA